LGLTNKYLVSAAADSILRVWSPETGICQHALSGHGNSITCFQHDNEKVISGSEGGLKMWDIQSGQFVKDLITDVDGVWRVSFDGRRCVAAVHK
jgi:WD40 repeat protein